MATAAAAAAAAAARRQQSSHALSPATDLAPQSAQTRAPQGRQWCLRNSSVKGRAQRAHAVPSCQVTVTPEAARGVAEVAEAASAVGAARGDAEGDAEELGEEAAPAPAAARAASAA